MTDVVLNVDPDGLYDIKNIVDVEFEVEKNSAVKPYFIFGMIPYSTTCIYNCRINFVLTVDGGTSCDITWDPNATTTNSAGRWSEKTC